MVLALLGAAFEAESEVDAGGTCDGEGFSAWPAGGARGGVRCGDCESIRLRLREFMRLVAALPGLLVLGSSAVLCPGVAGLCSRPVS